MQSDASICLLYLTICNAIMNIEKEPPEDGWPVLWL